MTKALARKECVIHSQMDHKNIVKLHKFAESPTTIELVMDYCSNSSYFEDRLEEVGFNSESHYCVTLTNRCRVVFNLVFNVPL